VFFSKLRGELRQQLQQSPAMLRFHGLRRCVETTVRGATLERALPEFARSDREYLRGCLQVEAREAPCSLVVE